MLSVEQVLRNVFYFFLKIFNKRYVVNPNNKPDAVANVIAPKTYCNALFHMNSNVMSLLNEIYWASSPIQILPVK